LRESLAGLSDGAGKTWESEQLNNLFVKKEEKGYTMMKGNSPKKGHSGIT
jgi:hypothetical protein